MSRVPRNQRIKNSLRRVKHQLWARLARVKQAGILSAVKGRYFLGASRATIGLLNREQIESSTTRAHARWQRILFWNSLHHHRSAVVVFNAERVGPDFPRWAVAVRGALGSEVVLHFDNPEDAASNTLPHRAWCFPRHQIQRELIRAFFVHDVILIDATERLPAINMLIVLKYAAHQQGRRGRIGAVSPSRIGVDGLRRTGVDFDRTSNTWVSQRMSPDIRDYGQGEVPRYVLAEQAHSLYITSAFIHGAQLPARAGQSWDQIVSGWVESAWRIGLRTLLYPDAVVSTNADFLPDDRQGRNWLGKRDVLTEDGRVRVIFILPATSISGGIRTVLQMSDGLAARGVDVEIWALQGSPDWIEINTPVHQFANYAILLDALAPQRAIKVATWWETGEIVWLASVNNGIPFQYVQEFESWFYPDHPTLRAAVVASYRREFFYSTIAEYQQNELREIGVTAELIPSAFDDRLFRLRPEVDRDSDTILALGRPFFQKNFALTLAAWRSLTTRPKLSLFGIEPRIAVDPGITYSFRPSDENVALLYTQATCFIQTSYHEGFSLPLIEAMACGCPVITTDSHGNAFCVNGVNCIMVEQDDVAGVAAAIKRLIGDPALQDRLRVAGLETAKRFTWQHILTRTQEYFDEIAAAAL